MTIDLRVPDGSTVVRRATDAEAIETGRLLLFRAPGGGLYWLHIDGGIIPATLQVVPNETPE